MPCKVGRGTNGLLNKIADIRGIGNASPSFFCPSTNLTFLGLS